jgi:glutamate-1-semialdehyde 2,1-aminomutase
VVKRSSKSRELFKKSRKFLAGGVGSHARTEVGQHPVFVERAKGSKLYDVDGNEYIDYALGYGALLFGHANPWITTAAREQLKKGTVFGTCHELEFKLSEKVVDAVPCADLVRYGSTGSDAVHAAIRLARAFTGKEKIVKFEGHYHGWFDNVFVTCRTPAEMLGPDYSANKVLCSKGQAASVLEDIIIVPWNDLEVIENVISMHREEIAAVIAEPVMCNFGVILPEEGYLKRLRQITQQNGVLLIFDEIITGFRLAYGGAQEYYGVVPDLAVYGKSFGGGLPISCFCGKKKVMELVATGEVVHSGTFNTNPLAMATSYAAITQLRKWREKIYPDLFRIGRILMEGIREAGRKSGMNILTQGPGPFFQIFFTGRERITDLRTSWDRDFDMYRKFRKELIGRGVYCTPSGLWFVSTSHTKRDIDRTLTVVSDVLRRIR